MILRSIWNMTMSFAPRQLCTVDTLGGNTSCFFFASVDIKCVLFRRGAASNEAHFHRREIFFFSLAQNVFKRVASQSVNAVVVLRLRLKHLLCPFFLPLVQVLFFTCKAVLWLWIVCPLILTSGRQEEEEEKNPHSCFARRQINLQRHQIISPVADFSIRLKISQIIL